MSSSSSSRSVVINPPLFGTMGQEEKVPRTGIISLVDIFDDFLFSGERSNNHLVGNGKNRTDSIHGDDDDEEDEDDYDSNDESIDGKPRKRMRTTNRNMTDEQRLERR